MNMTTGLAIASPIDKFNDGPRLLADIGGTNARFVLETASGHFEAVCILPCKDFPSLQDALKTYLASPAAQAARAGHAHHAAIAIANPVGGDVVKMTNHHWTFSIEALRTALGFDTLLVVNDFTALAMALPHLSSEQRVSVGGGMARPDSVIGLIGAGTGLGVSGMIPTEDRWIALGSEGGHVSFSPCDEREIDVLRFAWREFPHVSVERLLSGMGLELIYRALAGRAGKVDVEPLAAAEVTRRALDGSCAICAETVECFCAMLGTMAGNTAITLGALGGIYIGGGVVPRLGHLFAASPFRDRFEQKGRFSSYLAQIPTYVITAEYPAFLGVSAILAEKLKTANAGAPMLDHIRQVRERISASERRVADWVLAEPRAMLTLPIIEIAQRVGVSQPTVMRFCRSVGVQGLADFKLKLASGLTGGTIAVAHSQVKTSDTVADLGSKVLANSASAALALRDKLDVKALATAIELLRHAHRVELLGVGSARVVVEDAQQKFLNLGIVTSYFSEPQAQHMSTALLGSKDVVLVISRSGRPPELLESIKVARARSAKILAITASGSPLAKLSDVLLTVDHPEGNLDYVPMIVRLLQLMMVDILSVGLARRDAGESSGVGPMADAHLDDARRKNSLKFGGHLE
ncbi:MAG: glucokinase [Glaciimonas sp.]|nr:glucokinase [Glaciimonas sp.]